MFNNPGFEAETYQFSPYKEWNCQGELNDHRAGIMKRTMEYKKRGNFGGICTNRVAEWAGPGQYVGNERISSSESKGSGLVLKQVLIVSSIIRSAFI